MKPPPIPQVHPQTVKARLDAGEAVVLVDVRETWEYSLAHIPASINFPLGQLADCVMELGGIITPAPQHRVPRRSCTRAS